MTTIRPVKGPDLLTRLFYKPSAWLFERPDRVKTAADQYIKRNAEGPLGRRMLSNVAKPLGWFAHMVVSHDYSQFTELKLRGKTRMILSKPPIGALFFLLLPVTVGARVFRAWKRGLQNNNDFREVWDALIRDVTAISIFIFALEPLVKAISKKLQRAAGIKLVDPHHGELLTYSQFRNYRIDSPQALIAVIREDNGKGLRKAVERLSRRGLFETGGAPLKAHVTAIQQQIPQLIELIRNTQPNDRAGLEKIRQLAEQAYGHIDQGEGILKSALTHAEAIGKPELIKAAQRVQGELKDVVVKYAETRRLPADMLSFLVCVGAIGWFPVWFNGVRNRRNYEREMAKERAMNQPIADRRMLMQSLQGSSRLGPNRFQNANLP